MSLVRSAAALLFGVVGSALLIPDDNRMVQDNGLVRYPVVPRHGGPLFGRHSNFTKRQIETDSLAKRSGTLYTIDVTLGTPGQTVPVQFDTGSSELWVNPVCSQSNTPEYCNAQPRFTESTTLENLGVTGHVTYGTGYATFTYVADYVAIGSARITQQIFGVAHDSVHAVVGIMGSGPSLTGWESGYNLVIDSLAEQGLTRSRAFSMDLRGFDSARGSIIFGGIDIKKYQGRLIKLPIIPAAESPDGLTRFWVYLNGISVNQPSGEVVDVYTTPAGSRGQPVLLDSGYTLSALPAPIMQQLVAAFPSAEYVPEADLYVVDCLDPGQGGSLDFTFGDKVINVRYYDFVWHVPEVTDLCVLGAFEDDFPVLGDTFLRSAYVVYDWDNREIHLAQSEDCGSELVAIGSGPDAVPNLTGECGQTQTSMSSSTTPAASSTTSDPVSDTPTTSTEPTASESSESSTSEPTSSTAPDSSITSSTPSASVSSTDEPDPTTTTKPTITKSTITYTTSTTYTVTSCPPTVTNCPSTHLTTALVTATTTICPETTGTYTIHKTLTCSARHDDDNDSACPYGSTTTTAMTVTVTPLAPSERTTHVVPGCSASGGGGGGGDNNTVGPSDCVLCSAGGKPTTFATTAVYTSATVSGAAGATSTRAVVTAGAGRIGMEVGMGSLVLAAVVPVVALVGM